jgi:hypothetical protein
MEGPITSQICCTTKLLAEMGLSPAKTAPEEPGLHPLATWYADLFRWNRRKCVLFYNVATGYGGVSANLVRRDIQGLAELLRSMAASAMERDGFSASAIATVRETMQNPRIARTASRSHRAFMLAALRDAEFAMSRSVQSDKGALESAAQTFVSHSVGGPYRNPVGALGALLGEQAARKVFWHRPQADACRLRVTLDGIRPPIWRRVLVPSAMPLDKFHMVLQGAFGWTHSHLHCFELGDKVYEDPSLAEDCERIGADERRIGIFDLLIKGGGHATYVYDFGDGWRHSIELEERLFDVPGEVPRCLEGQRACPPEDVGGIGGYASMLEALRDRTHPEHDEYIEWLPEGWDPEAFSLDAANALVKAMQKPDWADSMDGD